MSTVGFILMQRFCQFSRPIYMELHIIILILVISVLLDPVNLLMSSRSSSSFASSSLIPVGAFCYLYNFYFSFRFFIIILCAVCFISGGEVHCPICAPFLIKNKKLINCKGKSVCKSDLSLRFGLSFI